MKTKLNNGTVIKFGKTKDKVKGGDNTFEQKTNKLDEILEEFRCAITRNNLRDVSVGEKFNRIEILKKEAKQAIIDWVSEEIIGEDETVMTLISSYRQVVNARNNFREEQRQKLKENL